MVFSCYNEHMNNHSYERRIHMEDRYNVECCDLIHTHEEVVERLRGAMPGEDTLYDLTELFRIFADSTRVRILYVLEVSEMCVCDLAVVLGMTQSAISHQDGKTVFYSLADQHVKTILDQGLEHINE